MKTTIATALFYVIFVLPARADLVEYNAFGFITNLRATHIDNGSLFGDWTASTTSAGNHFALPTVSLGDTLRISATYDSSLPDSLPGNPLFGRYNALQENLVDFSISVNSGVPGTDIRWSFPDAQIEVSGGPTSDFDRFELKTFGGFPDRFDFDLGGSINAITHNITGQDLLASDALPPDSLIAPDALFFLNGGGGAIRSSAGGVNGDWQIDYELQLGTAVFTTTAAVPEPSSLWLLAAAGLIGVGRSLHRRRRRKGH